MIKINIRQKPKNDIFRLIDGSVTNNKIAILIMDIKYDRTIIQNANKITYSKTNKILPIASIAII